MIKESKYILKRILIGVGIVLVLGFINSAKASALEFDNMTLISDFRIRPNTEVYSLYYDSTNDKYCVDNPRGADACVTDATDFPYLFCWNRKTVYGSSFASAINGVADSDQVVCYFTNKPISYYYKQANNYRYLVNNETFDYKSLANNYSTGYTVSSDDSQTQSGLIPDGYSAQYDSTNKFYCLGAGCSNFQRNGIILSNYDISNYSDNSLYYGANLSFIPGVHAPTIESLQPHKNIQQGVLFSYQFSPKFSNFDTINYKYQWKFGHDSGWNDLEENEQLLNFKNNGELYVRIVDKSNNSVIDNENFVVYGIGQLSSNSSIYDINFTDNFNSYTENHSIIVDEVKTDIEFIPDSDRLRYQYKFVPDNESADNVVWTTSATNKISYTTTENGTIYARITDLEYNTSYEETHTIPNIGKIGLGQNNSSKTNNFFQKLTSQINYGGPVSSLFIIPVNALTILYSNMSDSNTCSPIQLGSLLGTNMQFDCYNFKGIVGNEVYNIIDVIFAFVLTIGVFKFILKLYNDFISMKEV